MPVVVEEKEAVLSPMGKDVKKLLEKTGLKLLDKGRCQAIVENWRKETPFVPGAQRADGSPVPIPQLIVTDVVLDAFEERLRPLIEQLCHETMGEVKRKIKDSRSSDANGGSRVESFDTPVVPPRGNLVIPPDIR